MGNKKEKAVVAVLWMLGQETALAVFPASTSDRVGRIEPTTAAAGKVA